MYFLETLRMRSSQWGISAEREWMGMMRRGKEEKRKERNGVCPYDVFGVDRRRKS